MAKIVISPAKKLRGTITVPPDKSITHRAIMISALAQGVSVIKNPLLAEDCLSSASCIQQLGIKIEKRTGLWRVHGLGLRGFQPSKKRLDCGNSGSTMRHLSGILAGQPFVSTLFGDASLSKRPMDRIAKPLLKMGAKVGLSKGKFAPLTIQGGSSLRAIDWVNPVSSAQVKSCVLYAALYADGTTSYDEPSLSRDHTERMLAAAGVEIKRRRTKIFIDGQQEVRPQSWLIPGDFSSAAFFLVAAALIKGASVQMKNVNLNSTRTGLLRVLQSMGAAVEVKEQMVGGEPFGSLTVREQPQLRSGKIDESIVPHLIDEVPILAVAATQAKGRSILKGIADLRVKETDRISAMATNLRAMGASIIEKEDELIINGPTQLVGAEVDSFGDHRIAMSMAVAALIAQGETVLHGPESVSISFPNFWVLLKKLLNP